MERPYVLHMISPGRNVSPFDVNMACDAGYGVVMPYTGVALEDVAGLVQDAIFSRGPKGVKRTGLFIGGREMGLAMDMLEAARKAMVPPFEVSVCADPSGAFTTAAAMMAVLEHWLGKAGGRKLEGARVLVFGGTGPVGSCAGVIAAQQGAEVVLISHRTEADARKVTDTYNARYGVRMQPAAADTDEQKVELLREAEVVLGAAKAGVQVLTTAHLRAGAKLAVAVDVNAVPPEGIEGVGVHDSGKVLDATPAKAVGVGALAVGNVKYKVQQALFKQMLEAEQPVYLDFASAFGVARRHVA
jgi:methylene-tetrahydromethanopterin dehydrogenase